MASRIQLRRGTAAEWAAANPVLAVGEPGVETDTGKQKFGNGVGAWLALPYASKGDTGPQGVSNLALDTDGVPYYAPGAGDSAEVVDTHVAGLVADPASDTGAALSDTIATRVGVTKINVTSAAAAMTSAGIQAVIDAAPAGAEFYFERQGGGDGSITLTEPLKPSANGQKFIHERGLVIKQPNLYKPVYDILDRDDITIHDLTAVGPSTRPASGVAFRDSSTANYQAAVWSNSNRTRVTGRLSAKNFKIGVNFSAWDTATGADKTKSHLDNYIEDAVIEGADFGVLYYGQVRLRVDKLTSLNHIDSSNGTDPLHTIYGSGSPTIRSADVQIGALTCTGLTFGQAFQFKYTDGLQVNTGLASDCTGLLNLIDVTDFQIGTLQIRNTRPQTGNAGPIIAGQTPLSTRGHIASIMVDDAANAAAGSNVISFSGDTVTFGEITTVSYRASAGSADVALSGNKITVNNLKTVCAGVANPSLRIGKSSLAGADIVIRNHETVKSSNVVTFDANSTGTVYEHTPAAHKSGTFAGTGITATATSYNVYTVGGEPSPPLTVSTKTANYTLTTTDSLVFSNGATTIYLPTSAQTGRTYRVKNINATSVGVRVQDGSNIDGSAVDTLAQWATGQYVYDGAGWKKI